VGFCAILFVFGMVIIWGTYKILGAKSTISEKK
jgi:hypothetical protein